MMSGLALFFVLFAAEPADYMAVAPDALAPALEPLIDWRKKGGHTVRVLSTDTLASELGRAVTAVDIKMKVREEYEGGGKSLKFLLIVGDADDEGIPCFELEHYRWVDRDENTMASDVPFGDLEGDLLPEVAVGRLPVHTPEELKSLVEKILRFESAPMNGSQRLKVSLFAGASGYIPLVDRFLESYSRRMLDSYLPAQYSLEVIYASLASPYCPPPDRLGELFVTSLNRGPAYSVFMGHGSRRTCFGMYWDRGDTRYICRLLPDHLAGLKSEVASGPLFFFSCDNGFFDSEERCMAEEALLHAGGPVCTIASSRFSHPLPNLYSSQALLESLDKFDTVGELLKEVKSEGFRKSNAVIDRLLKNAEGPTDADVDVKRLKEDQVFLYNLLGDPATSIKPPRSLEVHASVRSDRSGIDLKVESPPEAGKGFAALYRLRTWEPEKRELPDPEASEAEWRAARTALHQEANRKEIFRVSIAVEGQALEECLTPGALPPPGKYRLVVYLASALEDAAGAVVLDLPPQ